MVHQVLQEHQEIVEPQAHQELAEQTVQQVLQVYLKLQEQVAQAEQQEPVV